VGGRYPQGALELEIVIRSKQKTVYRPVAPRVVGHLSGTRVGSISVFVVSLAYYHTSRDVVPLLVLNKTNANSA